MRKKGTSDTHQKRYGQYFSGAKVAELLVDLLPKDAVIKSAIDPMAGIGDLLRPVLSITKNVLAVEIDTPVAGRCAEILSASHVVNEDAFACEKIVTPDGWDLVITNPPYVRYQLQDGADGTISSRNEIRENLCRTIGNLQYLSPKDKDLLLRLAKNYSGLSDMAVPSWILCAALVKIGGLLAIVVPETWLSREYATPVQYMLTKCFDILTIAKDVNACWFENALVRTCLVVARRRTTLPLSEVSGDTLCLNIESNLVGEKSLIDRMLYAGNTATTALSALLEAQKDICGNGYAAVRKHTSDLFPHMLDTFGTTKWVQPEDFGAVGTGNLHPVDILSLLVNSGYSGEFFTLSDLKIDCGQGLRTGANDFFYLNIKEEKPNTYIMVSKFRQSNLKEMAFPVHNIIKALRNRSQVKGLVATAADLTTGLLFVQNEIRSADKALCADSVQYAVLDNVVAEYITAAEQFHDSRGLAFKDFSAVKPNERKAGEVYTRFWYMLPALSQRHLPVLCMTRINSAQPECLFVQQANNMPIAVDANFVTMWGSNPQTIKAAFTLLNSTWARCYLEALCTVMGGGALKLEAAQLKKLKFPKYTKPELQVLAELGEELIQKSTTDDTLQKAIDQATLKPFPNPTIIGRQIEELLRKKLTERGARQ